MTRSIYTTGGTVQAEGGVYLTRQADEELLRLCREGEFAYVLTPRQMGKSSLMVNTAQSLAQQGIQSVIIDLTQIGTVVDADAWYLGLLIEMGDQLLLETEVQEWWEKHAHLGVTQRLTRFFQQVLLEEVEGQVVIFVDEIDTTLNLNFTDDFFAAVRFLHEARAQREKMRKLSFVLIGVATPGDLIRDAKRTPFNIGRRVDLTDFNLEEAMPLAQGFGLELAESKQTLKQVLDWTSGHPYLTQRLCKALLDAEPGPWNGGQLAGVVKNTFLGERSEQDNNLQFVRDMLTKRAPDPEMVLRTYRQIHRGRQEVLDEEQSLVKSHLKLSGAVKREGKCLTVRNLIYRKVFDQKWIQEHLPENFWQRYKGVLKVAIPVTGASIVIALVMAGLYQNAEIQRAIAQQNASRAKAAQEDAEIQRAIAQKNENTAINALEEARQQKKEALKQKDMAGTNAEKAKQQEDIAKKNAEEAKEQAQEAERQKVKALKSGRIALIAQAGAEESAKEAELRTLDAERARENALKNEKQAQTEKQNAEYQTNIAQLREQAARVLNLLPTASAVDGLILAIDNFRRCLKSPDLQITASSGLLNAVQVSQEINRLQGYGNGVKSVVFSILFLYLGLFLIF